MMTEPDSAVRPDDAGLGLIEMIVAVIVSLIVLLAVGAVLINSFLTQNQVLSTSEATNKGQLIGSSIERAMRNAVDFETRVGGTELWVATSLDGSLRCQAFHLDDEVAEMKFAAADLAAAAWGTWLSDDASRSWQTLVRQASGEPFLQETSATTVAYTFDIETDSAPVTFVGEASQRSVVDWGSSPCW